MDYRFKAIAHHAKEINPMKYHPIKYLKKFFFPRTLLVLLLLLTSISPWVSGVFAETGYVSDMLILSLREGPGRQYNILSTLRSNTAVEILEKQGNYFKVKTEPGDIGWVERRYITPELPKTITIERLQEKIETLAQQKEALNGANAELQKEKSALINQNTQLSEQNSTLAEENSTLTKKNITLMEQWESETESTAGKYEGVDEKLSEMKGKLTQALLEKERVESDLLRVKSQYDALVKNSDNVAQLMEENDNLKKELENASQGLTQGIMNIFMTDNEDVLKTAMIKWFLSGAGVLILGWLIGRSFTGGSRKKRGLL